MTPNGVLQIVVFFLVIAAIAKPMGLFMTKVFAGERTFLHPVLRPLERLCYVVGGVNENVDQRWTQYAGSLLAFSVFSFLILYLMARLQGFLPLNPMGFGTAHAPRRSHRDHPDAGPGVQHRGQLHVEHQLAELFGRIRAGIFRPDGGADDA